jgi:DNA invertase Pin-like site-specific DNA recombinase
MSLAPLQHPAFFEMIAGASIGDVLLVERFNRFSRLNGRDYDKLNKWLGRV